MLLSNCSVYVSKSSRFVKEQEAKGHLSMAGKTFILLFEG